MNQHFIGTRRVVVALCLGLLVVALGALTASAANTVVTPANPDGWGPTDVRANATVGITNDNPRNGLGSLKFTTNTITLGQDKADFTKTWADPTRTLGALSDVSFEYYRDATSTTGANLTPVLRLLWWQDNAPAGAGPEDHTGYLIWEGTYNGISPAPTNSWEAENLFSQEFWMRLVSGPNTAGGCEKTIQNFDVTLNDWLTANPQGIAGDCVAPDIDSTTYITGVNTGVGSGWGATFLGYVDNVVVAFGADTVSANFEPNPVCTSVCYADVVNGNDANGGDTPATAKKTIQAAVNQVTAGGQVYVLDGLYPEAVTVNKAVTITGNGPANTTVDPTSGNGFGITASNVTIEDLKITDAAQGARLSGNISDITFDTVHFINNTSRGIEMQTATTDLITNVQVLNSLFDNNSLGMNMSTSTRVDGILIENTTFQNHANSGFQQNTGSNIGWVKNLTVRDSTFTNNGTTSGSAGVYAEEFSNVLIEDSTFTGNRYGINLFDYGSTAASTTTNVVIQNNTFTDHKASTIALRSTTSNPAAQLFLVDNNTINQNVGALAGAAQAHLAVTTSSASANGAVDVIDNDITFSGTFPTGITATYGIYLAGRAEDVRVEGNEIDGGGVGTNGATIPSSGIRLATSTFFQPNAGINITKNLINNFVNGVTIHDQNNVLGGVQAASVIKINRNDLSGNTAFGIQSGAGATTNGKCNWWGSASGPGPVGAGSGSNISANVDYPVWLFADDLNGGNVTNIDTGEVFCSIQEAIDDSDTVNGHTIVASAGVYQENVTVYKSVTLKGANAGISPNDPITPLTANAARGPESEIPVTGGGIAFRIQAPNVTIDGFKFTDSAVDQTNIQAPLIGAGGNYGGDAPGFKVINNLFSETSRVLVYSNGPNQMAGGTIDDNRAQDPGRADTGCGATPTLPASTCGYQLFNPWRVDGLSFQGNVTVAAPGSNDRVRTLNIFNSTDVTVADNTIRNTCIFACFNIGAGTSGDVEVTGNDIVTDVGNAIQIHSSWTTTGATINVHHNYLTTGNDFPIVVDNPTADLDNVHINRNSITGGKHVRNGKDDLTIPGTETLDTTCNWWQSAAGPNPANFFGPSDYTPWLYTSDLDGPCFIGGTIKVAKVAAGGGNTQFGFDPSWSTTNFTLADGGSQTSPMLQAGSYSVAEVTPLPTGWTLQSATCDNSATTPVETVNPSGITLADGDAWVCTFTNVYTPPPTNVCSVGTASSLWTDIIGKGMGNPKKHKNQVKLTIPNYAQVDSLYGQMVAKNSGAANYVRFILPGKNNWVQVNTITSPADHNAGNFWYGEYIDPAKLPTKTVTGRWFLQKTGAKNHIPRALVLYPTYRSATNTYVNIWNTYDAAEGEAYWDTANGWTQERVIVESIAPPNGPTTFNVELAVADNDKDARPIWVTVEAGGVTQTQMPNNPSHADQLNLMTFTLANVPAGTDEITITIYSPSMAADGVIGDSAALVGMAANYMCAPLN